MSSFTATMHQIQAALYIGRTENRIWSVHRTRPIDVRVLRGKWNYSSGCR